MSNLTSKEWWAAAGTRAIKTAAQAAIGAIGASAAVIGEVNWQVVAGAAALAAVVSLLTSLEGLPEVDTGATAAQLRAADAPSVEAAAPAQEPKVEAAAPAQEPKVEAAAPAQEPDAGSKEG